MKFPALARTAIYTTIKFDLLPYCNCSCFD